ncbi:dual oxidase maturation factor 1 isoform X2 [Zootermopsis nevadensis]|uniref:dual oxidase maturation factor 1 isoform X2 n=1 Tax=Zootermopsis nevadensis TaxID=136037 RepID=UPI000B8E2E3F|nr:dual oxidase maturation factor 1 isoform X2 [Zootermopsis nevadensis]
MHTTFSSENQNWGDAVMKGWFDAFRNDGGPTLYSYNNRTPVTGDVHTLTLYLVFFTVFLAFLVIFPGVRKERFTTFTSVTLSLFVGTVILVAKYGSGWHVACTEIVSSYRAFSREKVEAELGAYIGLGHVNITLRAMPGDNWTEDIDFNERFSWLGSEEMGESYREALVRGLPFPILTVAEYFSLGQEGFAWGGQYRAAGYYGAILLWSAFAMWLLMNLLLVVVPRYGAYAMMVTGTLLLSTDLVYYMLIPLNPLVVRFEGSVLMFRLGWCFWLVITAGALCIVVGLVIAIIDLIYPHRFSTILEVDYDTPYDRHIIIEESHDTRNNKKKNLANRLEEPATAGLGSRLLRRLSKRERIEDRQGVINEGFEMDPPKSPWRYPFSRTMAAGGGTGGRVPVGMGRGLNRAPGRVGIRDFHRTTSQDSQSSTCTGSSGASSLGLSFLHKETLPPVHSDPAVSASRRMAAENQHEVAMW